MPEIPIDIYTDGSAHPQKRIGAWVAIILNGAEKTLLSGTEENVTHNQMELLAVISAIEFVEARYSASFHDRTSLQIRVFCDSQYVIGLQSRKEKLSAQNFKTKNGAEIRNADLVKKFLDLIEFRRSAQPGLTIGFIQVKGHQKKTAKVDHHREADILCRNILRVGLKR